MTTPSPSPPISLSPPSAGERLARCTTPSAHSSPPPVPSLLLPSSRCPTQIQTLRIASTQALIGAVTAALPSPPLPPLPPSLYIPPPVDCRGDVPESEFPPRKRLCLSTLGPKYEIGESSTTRQPRPIGGRGIDYGFVSTVDAEARRQGMSEVGYGIRVTELAELHEHDTQDLYTLLEDAQEGRTHISQRVTIHSQRVDLLMEDRIAHQETILIMEEEAYASREAWSHAIGLSQEVHYELQTHREQTSLSSMHIRHSYSCRVPLFRHNTRYRRLASRCIRLRWQRFERLTIGAELLAVRGSRGELDRQDQMLELQITRRLLGMLIVTSRGLCHFILLGYCSGMLSIRGSPCCESLGRCHPRNWSMQIKQLTVHSAQNHIKDIYLLMTIDVLSISSSYFAVMEGGLYLWLKAFLRRSQVAINMDSSMGKMCLGKDVIEISSDQNEGSGDWDLPEYKDTAGSGGKKEPKTLVFHKIYIEEDIDRYITQCFVNGLYASDGEINLEKNDNLISNDYAVKLCLEYEVRKGKKLVKKELMVLLRGEIFGRSFLRSANAMVNFREGTITIQPEFDPFLLSSDEEKNMNLDDLETLLDFDVDEAPQTETDLSPLVYKLGKGSRNKKKVMENIMYFNNGAGPSSSVGRPLTQEEAEKRALAHNISMRYEILEEVRPVIETLAYNDKYRKLLDEIWADKVRLDGMVKPEEERVMVKVRGQMLKEKRDPGAFIFPIRLEGRINENALADTGPDTNTMPYIIYEKLGRDNIMKENRNITMINYTEAEVTGRLVNVLCQVGFTTLSAKFLILEIHVDRDVPIVVGHGFLDTIGGAYDHEAWSSRAKRSRNVETVEEALLPDVHHEFLEWRGCSREAKSRYNSRLATLLPKLIYSPQIVDWQLLHKIGCEDEIDQMLKISLKEAQSDEVIFFFVAWVRAFNIREPIYPELCREFYATYEFDEVCADDELQSKKIISFRLGGCAHSLTLLEFARRLGLYHADELKEDDFDIYFQGGLRSDENFNAREYWERISLDRDLHLSRSSITSVRFPILIDRHQNGYANVVWVIAKWMKRKGAGSQKDSQICYGQFISKIARKCRVLTDEIVRTLSTPVNCRDLDRTTLIELIDSEDGLIPEIPVDDVPRVAAQRALRVQRASMQDLYERMGSMEIRQEAIKRMEYRQTYHWDRYHGVFEHMAGVYNVPLQGGYNPPDYAQPQYDQYYQQYDPQQPPKQQHDDEENE
ncbi:ribonuclease H-like domain-containing protein [Tanacetum coccineum]|uniref:Ribonuclease H-like domain-containing protein n=1 Tax=Tanacetum coccineum TaxID=301880 RepID=A0ABQ5FH86_9ASTR